MDNNQKLTIKNWALADRPREKLLANGIGSLSDAELIATLIGSGNKDESAVELSKRILNSVGNDLNKLARLSVKELMAGFNGIGEAKGITIVAALELGRRRKISESTQNSSVKQSSDVANIFQPLLGDLNHEEFWAVFMNRRNHILEKQRLSQGGVSGTVIDVKILMKKALECLCSSIIICHNHPSGTLQPSTQDIEITKKIKNAGEVMDIKLLDHIIVTSTSYTSLADEGLI